jgi:hypothetical protein
MREVSHIDVLIDAHIAIIGAQRKEAHRRDSKRPGQGLAGSVSV